MLSVSLIANAQNSYKAIHWDIDEGLSNGLINDIIQDANGFLWIATQSGLDRFDGNTFKNYFVDSTNPITTKNNAGLKMIEDSLHNIWVGTPNGMARYDLKTDNFSLFFSAPEFQDRAVLPFTATCSEVYCIEGFSQITTYNVHTLQKKLLLKLSPEDEVYNGMGVLNTYFDSASNSIWMLEGGEGYRSAGGGLYEISVSTGERRHHSWPCYRNIQGHSHWSEAMRYDKKRNSLWINSPDGLIEFTLRDKQFHRVDAMNQITCLKSYNRFVGIDLDNYGRVWLATDPKGILVYDPYQQKVDFPFSRDSLLQNDVSIANTCLYCTRQNMVWSGFWRSKGLYQIIPFSSVIRQYFVISEPDHLSDNGIGNCVDAGNGNLWMSTTSGLFTFDTRAEKFKVLHSKDLPGIKGNRIVPAGIDTMVKKAWLHTEDGFFEMDMNTRHCRQIIFKDVNGRIIQHPGLVSPMWYGGYGQVKNGCFIPVYIDHKLALFTVTGDSLTAHQAIVEDSFSYQGTSSAINKYIFIRRLNDGTITYINQKGSWVRVNNAMDSIKRRKIFFSSADSSFWVGSEKQLFHFNKNLEFIRSYSQKDGLPENMCSFVADNNGNVWFTTQRSISELNTATGRIKMLSELDGYKRQIFSLDAFAFKDISGDLYFMSGIQGNQGFARIEPNKVNLFYPPPTAYIQSIEVGYDNLPFYKVINDQDDLSLKYFENNISIKTGVIDYYYPAHNSMIRYKLEGLYNNWRYAPVNYIIRYDGLPHGRYTLIIQAANAVGEFNGIEKKVVIHVQAPFWNTRWFYMFIATAILIGIYKIFQFRLKQKMKVFNVRQKLHRDLHDDVGATLSSIKVYSEILEENSDYSLVAGLIKSNAVDMIDRLEIIAWTTNPMHDSFKSFKEMVIKHIAPLCHAKNICFNIGADGVVDNLTMPGSIRQNLILICKESFNNVIKHADASECTIDFSINHHRFRLKIADNGNGFHQSGKSTGNGMKSMRKRVEELNGKIIIQSDPGKGTSITIDLGMPFQNPRFMG